jgi:4-hydroxy 2-oxovalerate aldolase
MGEIGVEYCEIGFFKNEEYVEKGSGIWRNLTNDIGIIRKLKHETNTKSKIAVMVDINNLNEEYIDTDLIPNQKETSIDLIRVFCIHLIIDKSIEVCKKLKNKGYTISLNIGHCAHLEYDELSIIKKTVFNNSNSIDYLYFADSLGMLTPNEINKFMIDLKEIYPVKNGFHNHNNHGTVFGNLINLLSCNIDILDGTISGFGKNGGNANIEQLIMYLCLKENYNLKLEPLLEFLEKIKDIDFGKDKLNILSLKEMLQQFMNVHSSYLKPIINKNLLEIYKSLKNLDYKKKIW